MDNPRYRAVERPELIEDYIALLNNMDEKGYELDRVMPQFVDAPNADDEERLGLYLIFRRRVDAVDALHDEWIIND